MHKDTIDELVRKTQRAWYEDGIWEIAFGAGLLLFSLYFWLVVWFDLITRLNMLLPLVQVGAILLAFLPVRWLMARLKERFTYPRTGYVTYRRESGASRLRRGVLAGLISVCVALLVVLIGISGQAEARVPVLVGAAFGAMAVYLALRFRLLRFGALGVLGLAAGALVGLARFSSDMGVAVLMSVFGGMFALSGLITLLIFLRRTPLASDEDLTTEEL